MNTLLRLLQIAELDTVTTNSIKESSDCLCIINAIHKYQKEHPNRVIIDYTVTNKHPQLDFFEIIIRYVEHSKLG